MKRVVVVITDGMRRDLVTEGYTPRLAGFRRRAVQFMLHRSVFPSATRVASASVATGCQPARHELQGNSLALLEDGVLVRYDTGRPDFLQQKRRVTGTSLGVPTLAERVQHHGGAITMSNASPGAAYVHDPDGYGFVYNHAGSFGPGRIPVPDADALRSTSDLAGDRMVTRRFITEILIERRPALAVLWLHEPDKTQHAAALGSPEHLAVLRQTDEHVGWVIDAVDKLREAGDDVLLVTGADHGHQTVVGVVDVEAKLVEAGLKDGPASGDVISAANGTAALVYVHPSRRERLPELRTFLVGCDWAGRVIPADELHEVGQAPRHGLAFAVSMRASDGANQYGVPGTSLAAKPREGKPDRFGFGQHGGLARYEQSPFLLIEGPGFEAGTTRLEPTSLVDIAPTVLHHLDLPAPGMDGRSLQRGATADS